MPSRGKPSSAPYRAAGIDLGSNTFRLLVADVCGSHLTVLAKELATVRLGERVGATGLLTPAAMDRGLAVLRDFRAILDKFQPASLRVCGTATLRLAINREQFLGPARAILQMPIKVISGEEEARLTLAGTVFCLPIPVEGTTLLADVGGSSTELVLTRFPPGRCLSVLPEETKLASLPLGAVGLTEELLGPGVGSTEELARLSSRIRKVLAPSLKTLLAAEPAAGLQVFATGGTATALGALELGMVIYEATRVHGHLLSSASLNQLRRRLAGMAAADRNRLAGLSQRRGEIVLAGLEIYRVLLELLDRDSLMISDAGLLEGILLSAGAGMG